MRTRLRRHAALLSLLAMAAVVGVVVASWTALRPTAGERDPLPEPIRIVEVPGSSPQPSPQSPAPALAPADPGPADVVPPPPLPDDDEDDDGDDGREGDGEDDD